MGCRRILIVAGEASADRYGARLVESLKRRHPEGGLEFFGTGGDRMAGAGVELLGHIRKLSSIGPREALERFAVYYETFRTLLREAAARRPAVAVLMDFPEFNLRLAKKLKRAGTTVVYYISPQIWAWRAGRIRTVRRFVDEMLVILPFEEEYYRERGVKARFVGHPLLEDFAPDRDRESFLARFNLDPARRTVALLPGSRAREVDYILPTLLRASLVILRELPAQFLISSSATVETGRVQRIAAEILRGEDAGYFRIVPADARDILANSDFALVKSGTSTLEAALVGTPFVVVYRISPLSWQVGNLLIRSPFKGLVNLIAGEEIVPEYLQNDATPEAISRSALGYLTDGEKSAAMRRRLARVRESLSTLQASETAAACVDDHLRTALASG